MDNSEIDNSETDIYLEYEQLTKRYHSKNILPNTCSIMKLKFIAD